MTKTMSLSFLSVFSGAGLADLGAIAAGFTPVGAIEYDADVAAVHAANHAHPCTIADALGVDWRQWAGVDVVHLSPSCQPYAVRSNGRPEDHRQYRCGFVPCTVVKKLRPAIVTVENAPAYFRSAPWSAARAALDELGYTVWAGTLNAKDFGTPQVRRRAIAVAVRGGGAIMFHRSAPGTWWGATHDLFPDLMATHPTAYQEEIIAYLKKIAAPGQPFLIQRCGTRYALTPEGRKSRPAYRKSSQQAFTVRALGRRCGGHGPDQMNVYRDGEVYALPPRFYARLMDVPDSFVLPSSDVLAVEVLGNGYPPLFARGVFEAAARSLRMPRRFA